jgi:hypothetical protein
MAFGDEDLATFFDEFAVHIRHGGVTKKGIMDQNDVAAEGTPIRVVDRVTSFTIPSSDFPTMMRESSITVDGVAMKVCDFMQLDDGAIKRVWVTLP